MRICRLYRRALCARAGVKVHARLPRPAWRRSPPNDFEAAIALKVRSDQDHLAAPVVKSLAEASVRPGVARPRLVLAVSPSAWEDFLGRAAR